MYFVMRRIYEGYTEDMGKRNLVLTNVGSKNYSYDSSIKYNPI